MILEREIKRERRLRGRKNKPTAAHIVKTIHSVLTE